MARSSDNGLARARLESIGEMTAFERIIATGSLSAAARDLDVSLAVVSKRLIRLEQALGTRLVNRTTRHLSLTAEGREFHAHCLALLDQVRRAEAAIANWRDDVSGILRITASHAFARRQIAPRIGRFLDRNPSVKIEIVATDDPVDIVREGIDLAIRQGDLPDSDLVARALVSDQWVMCAAPVYLAQHGEPHRPEDLRHHRCIAVNGPAVANWVLACGEAQESIEIDWCLRGTSADIAHAAALNGAGIALLSAWDVADDIDADRLVRLLPGWRAPVGRIHAVCPPTVQSTPRVRAFVEFLARELKEAERKWMTAPDFGATGVPGAETGGLRVGF